LGFYPVNTVSGEYIIGAPQLPKATIRLPGNKSFTIIANHLSETNKYVKAVKLNNQPIYDYKITYNQIMQGGVLEFTMSDKSKITH
jgi:putative alpha-1,2-mannosidase